MLYVYTDHEAFWDRVILAGEDECWLWVGALTGDGYGLFNYRRAHRVAWVLSGRALAKGKTLHHRCEVKNCVNPRHLQSMTRASHITLHRY